MNEFHLAVQGLGDLDAVVQAVASLRALAAGDAHFDGKILAHCGADLVDAQQQEIQPFLRRSPPVVLAEVGQGAQKLVDKPAVTGVDGDHVKTVVLGIRRGLAEHFGRVDDLLLAHGPDLVSPVVHIGRGPGGSFAQKFRCT